MFEWFILKNNLLSICFNNFISLMRKFLTFLFFILITQLKDDQTMFLKDLIVFSQIVLFSVLLVCLDRMPTFYCKKQAIQSLELKVFHLIIFSFLPDLLCFGVRPGVHNESEEMSLQQAVLSLLCLPQDYY